MENIAIVLLVIIAVLLWKVVSKPKLLPANSSDWIILVSHKIKDAGNIEKATWDPESPITIEFVPLTHWEYSQNKLIPIAPHFYNIWTRLNKSRVHKNTKYETLGYYIHDGLVFDIDDMRHSDFWQDIYDYAFAGYAIDIRSAIPKCYQEKFAEIIHISDEQRTKGEKKEHTTT